MRRGLVLTAVTAVAVLSILRQRREAGRVRRGELRPLRTAEPGEAVDGPGLHAAVARWSPPRPATLPGRLLATAWCAPLTVLGLAAAALGSSRAVWDPATGCFVATGVGGLPGRFLAGQSATAATLGQVVLVRDAAAPRPALLAHELAHVRQQERLGLVFAAAYPVASAVWGYRRNPFEVGARRRASLTGSAGPT